MGKRWAILLALATTVALPFVLRPKGAAPAHADDTLVVVTPHNEAIRHEFGLGFEQWYRARTGRTVALDWRVLGGTSEIARFLEGAYVTSFQNLWRGQGRAWSAEIEAGFQNGRLPADAPAAVREARAAFLASDAGSGIDVFFGGGTYDFERQAAAGRLVNSGVPAAHPEWFNEAVIPTAYFGETYRDRNGLWFGCVISSYGLLYNRDGLRRRGLPEPRQWRDVTDPRYLGQVALCDPTKSGSIAKAFENIIQQQMQLRLDALQAGARPGADLAGQAQREGWLEGLRLIQLAGANARYFTDSSQKPPIDVAAGDCTVGLCIDFYGRQQEEAVRRRGGAGRLGFVAPVGGTVSSVDPIALLRGAPHRAVAVAFLEYVCTLDAQKLWNFRPGTPGGPVQYALRRLPIRRDFYAHPEWQSDRSDPEADPYDPRNTLTYRPQWTAGIFSEMSFVIRVMCQDSHRELVSAWRAIIAAPEPARSRALARLQDLDFVSYDHVLQDVHAALSARDKVREVTFARTLGERFRAQYAAAERVARGEN